MSIFGNPVVIGGGGSAPVIQPLSATENRTYTAPSGVDGYSPVTVNVAGGSTLVTKTITENGTYDATDDNADGYSSVTVNVSGGGVGLLTQAQWDALTTAQKQSYGLVAIQQMVSGYERGVLVNGADYIPTLLIYSELSNIIAEEKWDTYVSGASSWGSVILSGSGFAKTYNAVRLPIGAMGAVSLPSTNYSVTAYVLINNYMVTSGDLTLFAVPYAYNNGNQPGFFVRSGIIWRTVYGGDTSTGVASNEWHVLTLALDNSTKTCRYYIDGVAYSSLTYNNSGSIVSLGAATSYDVASINADVAWVGVVSGAESEEVILQNQTNIMTKMSEYFA